MQKKPLRVLGPYPNRSGYRLVVLEGAARRSLTAASLPAALALKEDLQQALREQEHLGRTIGQALEEYGDYLGRVRAVSPRTQIHVQRTLGAFLPLDDALRSITPQRAEQIYRAETERISRRGTVVAADSHRLMLKRARAFFRWAHEQGQVSQNPFDKVKPVGRTRAGKPQLRIGEARQFMNVALSRAEQGDELSVGVLMMLLLGLRASEVMHRPVRDVDEDGAILWISRGKTKNARRRLLVPEVLQPLLWAQARGKDRDAWLFGTTRSGRPKHPEYLGLKVRAICEAAQVPVVCPHSLRGLHSTLALEAGATANLVSSALGHSSFAITARHYADPGTLLNAQVRRVHQALVPGRAAATLSAAGGRAVHELGPDELSTVLREQLSPEQLEQLRRRLFSN